MHLREHGVAVYGFGDAKTPGPFQSACTRFLVLDRLSAPSGQADPSTADDEAPASGPGTGAAAASGRSSTKKAAPAKGARGASAPATSTTSADPSTTTRTAAKTTKAAPAKAAAPATTNGGRASRSQLRQDNRLVSLLRRAVESAADDSGWAKIGTVGQRISNQSSFDSRNYGYAKLSRLIEATELFEIRDSGTPDMAVRDPRAG